MSLLRIPLRLLQGFFFHLSITAPNTPDKSELVNTNEVLSRTVSWHPALLKVGLFLGLSVLNVSESHFELCADNLGDLWSMGDW